MTLYEQVKQRAEHGLCSKFVKKKKPVPSYTWFSPEEILEDAAREKYYLIQDMTEHDGWELVTDPEDQYYPPPLKPYKVGQRVRINLKLAESRGCDMAEVTEYEQVHKGTQIIETAYQYGGGWEYQVKGSVEFLHHNWLEPVFEQYVHLRNLWKPLIGR